MPSTAASTLPALRRVRVALALPKLVAACARLPDPRRRQGTRYSLPAIRTLAVAAMRSNHRSLLAIAEWGAEQSATIKQALGFVNSGRVDRYTSPTVTRSAVPAGSKRPPRTG
jgi:hypothetical protein